MKDISSYPVNGRWVKLSSHREKQFVHSCPRCGWEGQGFHRFNCVPPAVEESK